MLHASIGRYNRAAKVKSGLSLSGAGRNTVAHKAGMTVKDKSNEEKRASITVNASGPNIFPSIPSSASMGMNVSAMINSPKMLGFLTSMMASATAL